MPDTKKWTLMFYFASDNPLAPSMISQVKAIKDAGYQLDTNVLVFFDPNEFGVPTRIFDVNHEKRNHASVSKIGDGRDSFVRNMIEDKVELSAINAPEGSVTKEFAKNMAKVDEISSKDALTKFLGFCREQYPADHYMLFLMGHGMIVASDDFLPDENPKAGITLIELGNLLRQFSSDIKDHGVLELIGMSSCSMSAIEVVYELKGTANYMLASQGFSFVGSWPYRQLLKKTFNTIDDERDSVDVPNLLMKLSQLCVHGSTDFMMMGYSADGCLCKLTEQDVARLNTPLKDLVKVLKEGLENTRALELILLAHLRSQSFWQEVYTDLFDFCFCLGRSCSDGNELQARIKAACENVVNHLKAPFVRSDHFGTINQYSHGLSVYFPWASPLEQDGGKKLATYQEYRFTTDFQPDSWFSFLEKYWTETQRERRTVEDGVGGTDKIMDDNAIAGGLESFVGEAFGFTDTLEGTKPDPILEGGTKPDPTVGKGDCSCPPIKNYPNWPFFSEGVRAVFEDD